MAYLTYLIDHYSALPSTIAFVHSHLEGWPQAWHTDAEGFNNAHSLNSLRIGFVQEHGYANLRCIHEPGCDPAEIQPFRNPPEKDRSAEGAMNETWVAFFGLETPIPQEIGTPCCSQFAVSRKQVLARPQSDYIRYRKWLLDTPLDDDVSGRVIEYLWHIMFGKDAVQSVGPSPQITVPAHADPKQLSSC